MSSCLRVAHNHLETGQKIGKFRATHTSRPITPHDMHFRGFTSRILSQSTKSPHRTSGPFKGERWTMSVFTHCLSNMAHFLCCPWTWQMGFGADNVGNPLPSLSPLNAVIGAGNPDHQFLDCQRGRRTALTLKMVRGGVQTGTVRGAMSKLSPVERRRRHTATNTPTYPP